MLCKAIFMFYQKKFTAKYPDRQSNTNNQRKETKKYFASSEKVRTFALAFERKKSLKIESRIGPVVQFG